MSKLVFLPLVLAFACPALAGEYEPWSTAAEPQPYAYTHEAAGWRDTATKIAPDEPPTNRDTIVLGPLQRDNWTHFLVHNTFSDVNWAYTTPVTFSCVTGDCSFATISHGDAWASGRQNKYQVGEDNLSTLTVLDPNGFCGYWHSGAGRFRFAFPSAQGQTNVVSSFAGNSRAVIDVPDAGTATRVNEIYNPGAVEKQGAGELVLGGTAGTSTRLFVKAGTVTLDGVACGDLDGILEKSALHFDASDAGTFDSYQADGKTWVTNWYDVRGTGVKARKPTHAEQTGYPAYVQYPNSPFVVTNATPNGLAVLDFGSRFQKDVEPAYGPTNVFFFIPRLNNVREVFYVARYHEQPDYNSVLGLRNEVEPFGHTAGSVLSYANLKSAAGALFVDGVKYDNNANPQNGAFYTNLFAFSCTTVGDVSIELIGSGQNWPSRVGGMQIGEILVYTNELPRAERTRVNDYLRTKWCLKSSVRTDANLVLEKASDAAFGVGAGRTVRVANLATETGTFVKTGEGTLEYDTLSPAGSTIDVRAGSVRKVSAYAAPTTDAPAADPLCWFDASVAASRPTVSYEGVEGTFVPVWRDCRDNGVVASALTFKYPFAAPALPTVVAGGAPSGLDVLDFGKTSETRSGLALPWYQPDALQYKRCVKAAFIVFSNINGEPGSYARFFGSHDQTFMREGPSGLGHYRLTSPHYPHPALVSAAWTVNGVPRDPTTKDTTLGDTDFRVIAFTAQEGVLLDSICSGMENKGAYAGCFRVGELIIYDREITETERRNTEAYLMKRWLKKDHPFAAAPTESYRFAADTDPVIDTDADLTVGGIEGGTGDVVKRGAGAATVAAAINGTSPWKSIAVEGGALTVSVADSTLADGAYYRFDASATDTMTYTVDAKNVTNVSAWADADGRDIAATNGVLIHSSGTHYAEGPTPLKSYLFQDGQYRAGFDFGSYVSTAAHTMLMTKSYGTAFVDGITVYRESGNDFRCSLFSTTSDKYSGVAYQRGSDGTLASHASTYADWYVYDYASDTVVLTNGSCALKDFDTHLVESVPTGGARNIDAICACQCFGGGQVLFEQVGFTNVLSAARREWWQRHLIHKWFGQGEDPVWTNCTLAAVAVAADSTLTFTGANTEILVARLEGSGSVTAQALKDVTRLDVSGPDAAAGRFLTISGTVGFADAVTVDVSGIGTGREFREAGNYPILRAGELENVDLANWTLTGLEDATDRIFRLRRVGNDICLGVAKRGTVIIVR